MKFHAKTFSLSALVGLSLVAWNNAGAAGKEKVTVCHKDKVTISIASPALPAHLAHGDTEGECPPPPEPEPAATTPPAEDGTDTTVDIDVTVVDVDITVEAEEEAAPELCKAPAESETTIKLEDGSTYSVALSSHEENTWTYQVEGLSGKDLSHWALGIEACFDHIVESDEGADIGTDGSTDFVGIKWDSEGGSFSFTLDADYPETMVDAMAKAGTMNATSLIVGPDCSAEPEEEQAEAEGTETEEEIPTSTTVALEDDKDSEYSIELVSHEGNTWTYQVDQVEGRDLSHWSLGIASCFENVTDNGGGEAGDDPSTDGFSGIKWDSSGGTFSVTLDGDYPMSEVEVQMKAGTGYAVGTVAGPDCSSGTVEELPICTSPEQLAEVPLEQQVLLAELSIALENSEELSSEEILAMMIEADFPRPFRINDLLFLPNMDVGLQAFTFGSLTIDFNFAVLLQIIEDENGGVELNVLAVSSEQESSESEITTEYSGGDLVLTLPVVDVVNEDDSITSFSMELVVVSFDPFMFQFIGSEQLTPEEEEETESGETNIDVDVNIVNIDIDVDTDDDDDEDDDDDGDDDD